MFAVMFILCLSVLPSFASAENIDILKGKFGARTDGSDYSGENVGGNNEVGLKLDATYSNVVAMRFLYTPTKADKLYLEFRYKGKEAQTISIGSLYSNQKKSIGQLIEMPIVKDKLFDMVVVKNSDGSPVMIYEMSVFVNNQVILDEITNLNAIEGANDVSFTWENPVNPTFSGVSIYKDNEFLKTVDKSVNTYKVEGLEGNKNYNFKFVATYEKGMSNGIQKGIKTLVDPKTIPPSPVSSLTAEPTDKTVKLKWKKPKDDDLAGFKILQNGKQIAEIGLEEEFTVKNLQSLTDYTFGVI
ncbi:fibronectin type III domain-containing protein, partial [Bacillus mycoides]